MASSEKYDSKYDVITVYDLGAQSINNPEMFTETEAFCLQK